MSVQPDAELLSQSTVPDSEDSDEETSEEEPPLTSWNELSIVDRVGLNSVEMSEKDLETAFSQIALAFRCDQYTLKQRLQAEEHARNLAEENIQLELSRGRETLETLKALCPDSKRNKILQRLELSLDILGGTVERIFNTAEVLGAVHQEARVSRVVDLMVAHVENLKRGQERAVAELEETKKLIQQQNSSRNLIEPRASPDPEESDSKRKSSQQNGGRRRISVSVIPNQAQEKRKRDPRRHGGSSNKKASPASQSQTLSSESSCTSTTKDDRHSVDVRPRFQPDETSPEASGAPSEPSPIPDPKVPASKQVAVKGIQNKNSVLDTLRQRHKGKAAPSKKKVDKDKKATNLYHRLSMGTSGSRWRRPMAQWKHRSRWLLLCFYLFVFVSLITLTYFFTS